MESYRLIVERGPRDAEWVLAWDAAVLTLTAPDGEQVLEVPPNTIHRHVRLDELYSEGKVCIITPHGQLTFRTYPEVLTAVRQQVEVGLVDDADFCADLRRKSLQDIPAGLLMFVVCGGLFGLYCWWATTNGDPPPGTWQRTLLVWSGCLIYGVLLVLLGVALAGPLISYRGLRTWLRVRRIVRLADREHVGAEPAVGEIAQPGQAYESVHSDPEIRRRLTCPRCKSAEVKSLPPSSISPDPGYACQGCGAKLRPPGTLPLYLAAFLFGSTVVAVVAYLIVVGEGGRRMSIVGGIVFAVPWLVGAGYAVMQLIRPTARVDRSGTENHDDAATSS